MPLTDTAIRNAKPKEKTQKLFDGGGLYLELSPRGGKWWRWKYRFEGKEKRLSLGVYPDISLKTARTRHQAARASLAQGVDPSELRKVTKNTQEAQSSHLFGVIAREWFTKHSPSWASGHAKRVFRLMERDIFPWLEDKPIASITAPQLLHTVRRIEARGALETAHRALNNCSQVLRYAVATSRAERDPTGDLRGALSPIKSKKHFAAVTDPQKVGGMLRVLDGYQGTLTVRCALRLAPLVFVRPGELRHARWEDIDLEGAQWRYVVTKTEISHIVPLATQAVVILEELRPLTGRGDYVFPGARSATRPMSDNAILAALRRLGIPKEEMSGHGFRAMARTLLDEVLGFRPDYIEHQLAHAVRDPNGRAYNRTTHLPERKKMMQAWADYLEQLKAGEAIRSFQQKV